MKILQNMHWNIFIRKLIVLNIVNIIAAAIEVALKQIKNIKTNYRINLMQTNVPTQMEEKQHINKN